MSNYGFLLLVLLLIPGIGAAIGAMIPTAAAARRWALAVSLVTAAVVAFLLAAVPWWRQTPQIAGVSDPGRFFLVQFHPEVSSALYLESIGFSFSLGMDGISLWLTTLTAFLMPLAILASFVSIRQRATEYYAWMLLLLMAMIGVFIARDLLLFYVFFELTLIPMFFIIGIWGGAERRYAAAKFFLFTFAGSVLTLAGVVYLGLHAGPNGAPSFDLLDIMRQARWRLSDTERFWVFMALLAGFAVKVPLFPVHTWLPLAHTEAPTAGSVILAGVLLKLGTYGLLRLAVPIGLFRGDGNVVFPAVVGIIGAICLIGIIYGALVAWVQPDIKKLVAYSSVSHLGFCVLGLFALNVIGIQGSVLYMVNHGLSTGALFLVIGMIYDRYHTRDIDRLSGLARQMPRLAFFFVLFALSSIGLPGLNGFVSEFLTVLGAFTSTHLGIGYGVIAALGIILGAVYMLHMVARVIWGPFKVQPAEHEHDEGASLPQDIGAREMSVLVPIAAAVVLLGVLPNSVLDSIRGPVQALTASAAAVAEDNAPPSLDARAAMLSGQAHAGERQAAPRRPGRLPHEVDPQVTDAQ